MWFRDLVLPIVSTSLLLILAQVTELPLGVRASSLLKFGLLLAGSWTGILLCGHVADAIGAPADHSARARILDDRYLGTFGACAISCSMLVILAVSHSGMPPPMLLAISPIVAALVGIASVGIFSESSVLRLGLSVGIVIGLAIAFWLVVPGSLLSLLISIGPAPLVAWKLRQDRRNGQRVAPTMVGLATFLCSIIVFSV
ncbi:MAG: hypothetical protein ACKVVP_25410 [Chloroflexota bacterium]